MRLRSPIILSETKRVDFLIWLLLPISVAVGSALFTYVLMRDRIELAVARERMLTREAQLLLRVQVETSEERVRVAEDHATRQVIEKFFPEFDNRRLRTLSALQPVGVLHPDPRLIE